MTGDGGAFIVLCAGLSTRFGGRPKHQIEVHGETLLSRTIRLCQETCPEAHRAVVCLDSHEVGDVAERAVVGRLDQSPPTKLHTMLLSEAMWGSEWTCWLLGDVHWTERSFPLVLPQPRDAQITFVGRCRGNHQIGRQWGELYAVRCRARHYGHLRQMIGDSLNMKLQEPVERLRGNLWGLMAAVEGTDAHPIDLRAIPSLVAMSDPLVDDVDTEEDLDLLCSAIDREHARLAATRPSCHPETLPGPKTA